MSGVLKKGQHKIRHHQRQHQRLTDRPDMTLDHYRGRKLTTQQLLGMFMSSTKHLCNFQSLEATVSICKTHEL